MGATLTGPIRAVLFDVDGTLYAQGPLRALMACEMAAAYVLEGKAGRNDVRMVLAFRHAREMLRSADGHDEPLLSKQYSAVSDRLGCSPEDVERAVSEWIYHRPLKWLRLCRRPGLERLLAFLTGRGIRCGVFSDYPADEKLTALRVASQFEFALSAVDQEIGAFKPAPVGFLVAAARWGIPVRQILYVGDRFDVDVAGASAAGMPCAVLGRRADRRSDCAVVGGFAELQRVLDPIC